MNKTEQRLHDGLVARGIPFRNQDRTLPGTPDFIVNDVRIAVFVHGCYWHRHEDCGGARTPAAMEWTDVFRGIVQRDTEVYAALESDGWWVVIAWECDINRDLDAVLDEVEAQIARRVQSLRNP